MTDRILSRRKVLVGGSILSLTIGGLLPSMCAMRQLRREFVMKPGKIPRRPAGKPKPLLDEEITPVLGRLDAWYAAHLRQGEYVFNPPASETRLDAFERLVGIQLPRSYRAVYRWHDGENDDRWGHIFGLPLLPLDRAAMAWKNWNITLAGFAGNRYAIPGAGWPEGAVDPAYINSRWVPLTEDGSGNHIGLDFDPWPGGRVGQVILFGRDEDVKVVLAESLFSFLDWVAKLLEGGNFRLGPDAVEPILRQFRLKQPPSNHFHEGARLLLGAPKQFL